MNKHFLTPFFEPKTIAVIGASETRGSLGNQLMLQLAKSGFSGQLFPVNPGHKKIHGLKARENLRDISEPLDLVLIATEPEFVMTSLEACGSRQVTDVVILTPIEDYGYQHSKISLNDIHQIARQWGIKIIGPNGFGLINPTLKVRASLHDGEVARGNIALVSQSGAVCSAVVDWAKNNGVGFSHIVCLEKSFNVDLGEVLSYLLLDATTECILLYVEGVHDARTFLSGLRAAARGKPVIVLKSGSHIKQAQTTMYHTGAMVGDDDVFGAALERAGVVRAEAINDLFLGARAFQVHRKVRGDRIGILSNGNAMNIMACDRADHYQLSLPALRSSSANKMVTELSGVVSANNPIQLAAVANADQFRAAYQVLAEDDGNDIILVNFAPQPGVSSSAIARNLIEAAKTVSKPLVVCWMGGDQVAEARRLFQQAGIPAFSTPENAMKAVGYLVTYFHNKQLLLQTPDPIRESVAHDRDGARLIIEGAMQEGRKHLLQIEAKAVLKSFGIPVSQSILARSANEALVAAESRGFPVVLKINSPDIHHKTDVQGISLSVSNAQAVRTEYKKLIDRVNRARPEARVDGVIVESMRLGASSRELYVGIKRDPVFGPVIAFGIGGSMVEILAEAAVSLPPLNDFLVANLIDRTKASRLIERFRDMAPVNRPVLEKALLSVSQLASELPWIQTLEINPLLADEEGVCAVDASVHVGYIPPAQDRYAHMAIHPYPSDLTSHWQLASGMDICIRPIRPEDAGIEKEFIENLSKESRYFRFMHAVNKLTPEMLVRFTQIDYHRELALIATYLENGAEKEIGVARYVANPDGESCEFAVVVADQWQRSGVGYQLMEALIKAARLKNFRFMDCIVLRDNKPMLKLAHSLGFVEDSSQSDDEVYYLKKML
ncbi:MAG: bifunctional acetate--CoA ligase family protein/GNAT family N-acetyltransferase [Ketobacteraceae bacterium]|nr:bifunctional acetate--CoA ligase family protein/GNAT family N-acetyltransferase [Ketobacteraceae bacterium]